MPILIITYLREVVNFDKIKIAESTVLLYNIIVYILLKGRYVMATFCDGSATVDEILVIQRADDAFYQFVGSDIYAPFTHRIHPDDVKKFTDALHALKADNMPINYVTVRVMNANDEYCWLGIELSCEPFDLHGRPLYHLALSLLSSGADNPATTQDTVHECEVLLGLMSSIVLSYSSETDILEIYTLCNEQKIYQHVSPLLEWQAMLIDEKVDPDSVSAFQALILNLQTGQKHFTHHILTNAFSSGNAMEVCTFRCQTIPTSRNHFKVLGCIAVQRKGKNILADVEHNLDAGLPILSKKAITEYVQKVILSDDSKIYLVILDVDNFKTVNDTYGHFFGDEVLATVADIIKKAIGNSGVVGRIGGDEMMIVLTRIDGHAELRNLLRTIRTNIEWAYKDKLNDIRITCSMGVSTYPDHAANYEELFQLADKMLYIAKQKGKNRYVIYIPEIHAAKPVSDTDDASSASSTALMHRNDKTGVMQRLISDFLLRKIVTYEQVMNDLIACFELDEIIMIYSDMKLTTSWDHTGVTNNIDEPVFLSPSEDFWSAFDANHIYANNTLVYVESKAPELYQQLLERKAESILFYQMKKRSKTFGYLMFIKKNRRQLLPEYEKTLLGLAGKIIELSMIENKS